MSDGSNINPEFIVESQELVDALNRDLIAAGSESTGGDISPDRINNLFRSAHSLKGISGIFGVEPVTRLAHALESVLDGMRMGRVRMEQSILDTLFACVDEFGLLIAATGRGESTDPRRLDTLVTDLDLHARGSGASVDQDPLQLVTLGQDVLSVLTEYEEHRLRENIRRGLNLYILRTSFDLNSFDMGLAELDAVVKDQGEVITKLPSSQSTDPGTISFDIIVGVDGSSEQLIAALADDRIEVIPIQRTAFVVGSEATQEQPSEVDSQQVHAEQRGDSDHGDVVSRDSLDTLAIRSVSQTVRVDIKRLDRLMNLIGELALTRIAFQSISDALKNQMGFAGLAADLHKVGRDFERRLNEIQSGIMDVRMVPLTNLFERMVRVGRKAGRELGKYARIDVEGEHTELDKLIVEDLADPLMHLIRNAIDHGIETPEEREQVGKPVEGVVHLSARALGNHVVVRVTDDGRGIDTEELKRSVEESGLISSDRVRELGRRDALNLIFSPGLFHTRASERIQWAGCGDGRSQNQHFQAIGNYRNRFREGSGNYYNHHSSHDPSNHSSVDCGDGY